MCEEKSSVSMVAQETMTGIVDFAKHKNPETGEYELVFFELQTAEKSQLGLHSMISRMIEKGAIHLAFKRSDLDNVNIENLYFFKNEGALDNGCNDMKPISHFSSFIHLPGFSESIVYSIFSRLFCKNTPEFLHNFAFEKKFMGCEDKKAIQRFLANINEETRKCIPEKIILLPPGTLAREGRQQTLRTILEKFQAAHCKNIVFKSEGVLGKGNVFFTLQEDMEENIQALEKALIAHKIGLDIAISVEAVSDIALLHQDGKKEAHADIYRVAFQSVREDPDQFEAAIILKDVAKGANSHEENEAGFIEDHYATKPPLRLVVGKDAEGNKTHTLLLLEEKKPGKAHANVAMLKESKPALFEKIKQLVMTMQGMEAQDVAHCYEQNEDLSVGRIEFLDLESKLYFVACTKKFLEEAKTVREFFAIPIGDWAARVAQYAMLKKLDTSKTFKKNAYKIHLKNIVKAIFAGELQFDPAESDEALLQQFEAQGFIRDHSVYFANTKQGMFSESRRFLDMLSAPASSFSETIQRVF